MATKVKASAKGDLKIWKLSLLYSLSRAVHGAVQRKQFTFVVRVQNLCGNAVGKEKVHREMDLFCDAQEKTAMDKLQSARKHNFLTLNFLEKILALSTCGQKVYNCLQDKGNIIFTVNHRLNFVDPGKRAHSRALERHDAE